MASPTPTDNSLPASSRRAYLAVSPEGIEIEIPKELFMVLHDFLQARKEPGSMVVHFRSGGIAGLEAMTKKAFK